VMGSLRGFLRHRGSCMVGSVSEYADNLMLKWHSFDGRKVHSRSVISWKLLRR
jgi:hypothetical protein